MITKENFKELIETINPVLLSAELDKPNDYIYMVCHTFNTGSYATIKSVDYNSEEEEEANANGQLYCDKDAFFDLYKELI